jgi:hypothetical protein
MSTVPHSKNGPPLKSGAAEERQLLIAADEAFTKRLTQALQRGDETPAGLLATVDDVKHFQPWRFTRDLP